MSILEAIFLGIIQGATEFLPISSSGHLLVVPAILGLEIPDPNVIAIAHLGSLLAVLVYFRRDLWQISLSFIVGLVRFSPLADPQSRFGWLIILGTIPAALAGLLFEEQFDRIFGNPSAAAAFLLLTAIILIIGERLLTGLKPIESITWRDALLIGFAQMLALLPGISRSGSTITAGLSRGLDRESAARFSFILGVPAIIGAGLLAGYDLLRSPLLAQQLPALLATFTAAAITGYLCIALLLAWLRRHSLYIFAAYCLGLSLLYFLVTFWR